MNIILRKTHIPENIKIIKAREYYFNKAKALNLLKTGMILLPPVLMALSYVADLFQIAVSMKEHLEVIVGVLTIAVMFGVYVVTHYITHFSDVSNTLRAYYDHRVLGAFYNHLIHDQNKFDQYLKKADRIKYKARFETWYMETFCANADINVFCCQMDNLIYSKHAYTFLKKLYVALIGIFSVIILSAVAFSVTQKQYETAFLLVMSVMECYDVFIGNCFALTDAIQSCKEIIQKVESLDAQALTASLLVEIQAISEKNRALCIFVPKPIRNYYLENKKSAYHHELSNLKYKFMGSSATIPDCAADIDIVSDTGSFAVPLTCVQVRLHSMLQKVVPLLEKANIQYTLDGGTLIGCMRNSSFIPWDDDIDIAISSEHIEKAKEILRSHPDFELEVQDADNEPYYSPRLAAFRIREKNDKSIVSEKDSPLYEKYKSRGFFIDVYEFSPILLSRPVDSLFRYAIIHPLNYLLLCLENNIRPKENQQWKFTLFKRLKSIYLGVLKFYRHCAKNSAYYAYFPGYVYQWSKAGPYHKKEDLYGKVQRESWEGREYRVPSHPTAILTAYYGEDWEKPPFRAKKELEAECGKVGWFKDAPTEVTALKHISNIVFMQ